MKQLILILIFGFALAFSGQAQTQFWWDQIKPISTESEKTTPVATDRLVLEDSEDGNNWKYITISNLPTSVDSMKIENNFLKIWSASNTAPDSLDLSVYLDNTDDQQLTISNDTIFLEDGGYVELPEGDVMSLGTDGQLPYMNAAGDDFLYSAGFEYSSAASKITVNNIQTNGIYANNGTLSATVPVSSGPVFQIEEQLGFENQTNDPALSANGNAWFNSTLGKYRARINGSNYSFLMEGDALESFTETDPVFSAHTVSNISDGTGFLKNTSGTWSYETSLVNYGTSQQLPYMNTTGDGFSYNSNLTYNGNSLQVTTYTTDENAIHGYSDSGYGIYGNSNSDAGVFGQSSSNAGVVGLSSSGPGGSFVSTSSYGVVSQGNSNKPDFIGQSSGVFAGKYRTGTPSYIGNYGMFYWKSDGKPYGLNGSGNEIELSGGTGTDDQTLSLAGNTLSIEDGGSVDISTATAVAANIAKETNATHTGEVTGSDALTIASNVVDRDNLDEELKDIITDNDCSFDMSAAAQFNCTPTANGTITFTNIHKKTVDVLLTVSSVTIVLDATIDEDWIFGDGISGDGVYLLQVKSVGTSLSDLVVTIMAKQ